MSIESHVNDFLSALNGSVGELDAWLECNNEDDVKAAMQGALARDRTLVAAAAYGLGGAAGTGNAVEPEAFAKAWLASDDAKALLAVKPA